MADLHGEIKIVDTYFIYVGQKGKDERMSEKERMFENWRNANGLRRDGITSYIF